MKARVAWTVRATGYQGHGGWTTLEVAESWVKQQNKTCPEVHHWVEIALETACQVRGVDLQVME
jgi:hypothetical protein